ncbi:MAG: hypothetical protein KTR31_40540 [Myxococcales bacterium]|nr:hypothetical protein [Myxococcales bacterium]
MRLTTALGTTLLLGLACTGLGGGDPEETTDELPDPDAVMVVPVPVAPGAPAGEAWCCEYVDDDGNQVFALLEGEEDACREQYGAFDGRWVNSEQCTPCCCESPLDPFDATKGLSHELTTPSSCAKVGTCVPTTGHPACMTEGSVVDTAELPPDPEPEDPQGEGEGEGGQAGTAPEPAPKAKAKPKPGPRARPKSGPVHNRKGFKRRGSKN